MYKEAAEAGLGASRVSDAGERGPPVRAVLAGSARPRAGQGEAERGQSGVPGCRTARARLERGRPRPREGRGRPSEASTVEPGVPGGIVSPEL